MYSSARFSFEPVAASRAIPSLAQDVRTGLLQPPRSLPPKYFYDEIGSRLFERICQTPEYYPSRTEGELLATHAGSIIARSRPDQLIELGSGSARKTRHLLDACGDAGRHCVYWPFDVAEDMLLASSEALVEDYPWLRVQGLIGDYNGGLDNLSLPEQGRRLFVFLGGTIGNFEPQAARAMLGEIAALMRAEDCLLLGADRVKPVATLEAAYDDAQGHTARFNLNVLDVLNRELDANFPVQDYRHRALFNHQDSRIEMRLRATTDHRVRLTRLNEQIEVTAGEEILTEVSHKFSSQGLQEMISDAGMTIVEHYQAPADAYSLVLARRLNAG